MASPSDATSAIEGLSKTTGTEEPGASSSVPLYSTCIIIVWLKCGIGGLGMFMLLLCIDVKLDESMEGR
jgi:hypothetical protein